MPSVKTRVALLNENYRTASGEVDQLLTGTEASTTYEAKDATLTALAAHSSVGLVAMTSTADTFVSRTLTGPAAGITVAAGNGSTGNPTLALANDLAALEGSTGTNTLYYRSGVDTWSPVTIDVGLDFTGGTLKAKTLVTTTTSTSFTASSTNANSVVQFSTLATFSIPSSASVNFDVGTWIEIHQMGSGAVTPTAASTAVTLNVRSGAGTGTAGQYAIAAIRKTAANTWILTGDLV